MLKAIRTIAIILFLGTPALLKAQSDVLPIARQIKALQQYAAERPVEKVHLQLDRDWYGLGDTIWFKAYTVIGDHHALSDLSGVLYTELIGINDNVLQRLTIKLTGGTGAGDFTIPTGYVPGNYRIRAYTNWMRNDSSAYFYDRAINIGGIGILQPINSKTDTQKKAIALIPQQTQPAKPDVQFFPEGGQLVNGLRSKVAFKAVDLNGNSISIKGSIIDEDNNEVALFETQHNGMGEFPLKPQPGKEYRAKITTADGSTFYFNLPKARDHGFTLTVNNAADSIHITVAANDKLYKSGIDTAFYLLGTEDGEYYYATGSKLSSPVYSIQIAAGRFPTGIARFTLFSQNGEPLCERVVFIQHKDLNLELKTAKDSYTKNEAVNIQLSANDETKNAATGNFSVAVTNETEAPVDEQSEHTIFTDLLLSEELKGNIENPNYYFTNENDKTRNDLDLLMLTQGYRRFEWQKVLAGDSSIMMYKPETSLHLSGTVTTMAGKPVAGGKIQLTSIKDFLSADTVTDAKGNFTFTGIDLNDSTKLVINAKKAKGSNNVRITINPTIYAPVDKTEKQTIENTIQTMPDSVLTALKNTYVKGLQLSKKVIRLAEVKVKDHRNTHFNPVYSDNMKFSANLNGPGNADEVILSDVITRNGGGKLSDILVSKIFGVEFINGIPRNLRNGGKMALFIEGAQASPNMLDDINPYDIYSIEVLRSGGYSAIYGSNAPYGALIITMKHGVDKVDNSKISVDGLVTYRFNGFYKAREFYSPKYYPGKLLDIMNDRETIYWNPNITTDTKGKASFSYYNAATKGYYQVVIEGIDSNGNLARQVYHYKVQ